MIEDKNIAKVLRRLYGKAGGDALALARVRTIDERVRAELTRPPSGQVAEFTTPSGRVVRYIPPTGRNAGRKIQIIEHGLTKNDNPHWNEGDREIRAGEKFGRSPSQVHRIFKESSFHGGEQDPDVVESSNVTSIKGST
jgi:hypothetical protein